MQALSGRPQVAADRPPSARVVIDALGKRFGRSVALDGVSLVAEPGQFVVLLGPSGSGKTTLLRCLAGIESVDSGSIAIDGQVVAAAGQHLPPERRNLAMVFQDHVLWPHMSVLANVVYALHRLRLDRSEAEGRARAMLARVGLQRHADRYPNQLSGGEQQRVALARALAGAPRLLLFDEPLSSLDAGLREQLRVEIAALTREANTTAIYITHDQAEAFALADVLAVLGEGRLVQIGSPEEVYRAPQSAFVALFTGIAGELRGRAGPSGGGRVRVSVAGGEMIARSPAPIPEGAPARLLIRPEALQILAEPRPAGCLPGVVYDCAFRGRGYEHAVELAGGERLTKIHAGGRIPRGTPVALRVDADGCFAFAEGPEVG